MISVIIKMAKELTPKDEATEFLLYNSPNGEIKIDVFLHNENIWLTQKRMAELFDVDRSVITKHLKNIFDGKELDKDSVCAKIAHTANDGKIYQTQYYNLDAIISVGYRVNSMQATHFRIWATKILKESAIFFYLLTILKDFFFKNPLMFSIVVSRILNKASLELKAL